ncbi:MAG TPA: DUF655 domain-containing protein, partial [Thermoproteales archaeon]|nr:DUF655 domain-containing protein [Thermoproteales archaeon]
GYYSGRMYIRGPIAQAIGEKYFTLLELVPFEGIKLSVGERVSVGKSEISLKIQRISRRLRYDDLTSKAKDELPKIIEKIVIAREKDFVDFFNKAPPLTPKMHSLELLRGIGKKTLWTILEERRKKPFESFEDIQKRTRISDPVKLIVTRVLEELQDQYGKYKIFTKP